MSFATGQDSSGSPAIDLFIFAPKYPAIGIGYQKIWDMRHIWLNMAFGYYTIGFKKSYNENGDERRELEWIIGLIPRWVVTSNNINTNISFGLFGGVGLRHVTVCPYDMIGSCYSEKEQKARNIILRHELGAELILGYYSLYISEANFRRIGGGIGLILWEKN